MDLIPIRKILNNKAQAENLSHPKDSGTKSGLFTPDEARANKITWNTEPPENDVCKYCGKILEHKGVAIGGKIIVWQPMPIRCDCPEARKHWEDFDRKRKEKEIRDEESKLREHMRKKVERLISDSGIKKRFRQRTFSNFRCDTSERKRCFDIAKEFADNWLLHKEKGGGLYIEGNNGTGKTHLVAAIALQLMEEGIPVIFKTSNDLLYDIKKAFDNEFVKEYEILDIYKNADLLIIDDLGKEQCSDWSMTVLYTILNARYEDMRSTIITTNYNTDGLLEVLTPKGYDNTKITAVISRLRETNRVITMAWNDIRGKKI